MAAQHECATDGGRGHDDRPAADCDGGAPSTQGSVDYPTVLAGRVLRRLACQGAQYRLGEALIGHPRQHTQHNNTTCSGHSFQVLESAQHSPVQSRCACGKEEPHVMSTWQVRVNDCWLGASPGTSALRARAPLPLTLPPLTLFPLLPRKSLGATRPSPFATSCSQRRPTLICPFSS